MIFRTMLENGIFDSAFYINIDEAIDDTIERNEAAGRPVDVIKHTDRAVQFRINYPDINRTVEGTISPAPGAHTAQHEDSYVELIDDFVDLKKQGFKRQTICRKLGISYSVAVMINRMLVERRKKEEQKCLGSRRRTRK